MQQFSNNATATLAAPLSATPADQDADTITVANDGGGETFAAVDPDKGQYQLATLTHASLPGQYEVVRIDLHDPYADITAFQVARGWEGTALRAWPVGTVMQARVTAGMLGGMLSHGRTGRSATPGTEVYRTSRGNFTVNGRPIAGASNVVAIAGFPVPSALCANPAGAHDFVFDPAVTHEIIGMSRFVELGPRLAWSSTAWSSGGYHDGSVVVPSVATGYQYSLDLNDADGTPFAGFGTTEPDFATDPSSPVPAVDSAGNTIGYWLPSGLTKVDIRMDTITYESRFVPTEVGFICYDYAASGSPAVTVKDWSEVVTLVPSTTLTGISGEKTIHRLPIDPAGNHAVDGLSFTIDSAPMSGTCRGRFYWRGFFL